MATTSYDLASVGVYSDFLGAGSSTDDFGNTSSSSDSEYVQTNNEFMNGNVDTLPLFQKSRIDLSKRNLSSSSIESIITSNVKIVSGVAEDDLENPRVQLKVEKFVIHSNCLSRIPNVVHHMTSLTTIDLSNNCITSITDEFCVSLLSLTHLYVRNNQLSDLPKSFSQLTKLRHLNLSGNLLTRIPISIYTLRRLQHLYLGGNKIGEIGCAIKNLKRLQVLYLGGNELRLIPSQICHLSNLNALILSHNFLEELPSTICDLTRLEVLQVHNNHLTILPHGLVHLASLSELSIRDNPLVKRFIRTMSYQPSTLTEIAARCVVHHYPETENTTLWNSSLPNSISHFLRSSHRCVNAACKGVYFLSKVEHVKFVDFCGRFRVPLVQYLCSTQCENSQSQGRVRSASSQNVTEEERSRLRRVLLG